MEELKEGTRLKGKVVRMQPFGSFVELKPGVDGLIHISAMSDRRIAHPKDVMKVGDEVEVQVEKLDPAEKKISLRLVKDGAPVGSGVATSESHAPAEKSDTPRAPRPEKARRGQIVTGKVDRVEPFGVFIAWEGGKGMIPASETGTDRGTDLRRTFPMGTEIKAEVIEIQGEKLKLSITAAIRSEERADLDAWKKTQKPVGGGKSGFGTLADKFKGLKLS
jgi:small subunit ribosomal protein S1